MSRLKRPTGTVLERWAVEANRRLVMYCGWVYGHDIPAEVSDAWWHFCMGVYAVYGRRSEPHEVPWPKYWGDFTDLCLINRNDYRAAIEAQEPKIVAVIRSLHH